MKVIRIATRASKLALAQTKIIQDSLYELDSDIDIQIVTVSTEGDVDKSDFLYKSSTVGLFTSAVENALLENKADIAVHSLKDLPTAITPGLIIAAIPKRDSVADAIVASTNINSIYELLKGAEIGTSSLRRIGQLYLLRNDIKCVPLRGNVETRVSKVVDGKIDAAIVACAGLNRLGLSEKISAILDPKIFPITPGQGALAVQTRADDNELIKLISKLDHKETRITTDAERQILAEMQGGCSIPLGVYSQIKDSTITIHAMVSDIENRKCVKKTGSAKLQNAQTLAKKIAHELLSNGAKEILEDIRKSKND